MTVDIIYENDHKQIYQVELNDLMYRVIENSYFYTYIVSEQTMFTNMIQTTQTTTDKHHPQRHNTHFEFPMRTCIKINGVSNIFSITNRYFKSIRVFDKH